MTLPEFRYMAWAKSQPRVRINLARSGIEPCPVSLLGVKARDLELVHPPGYGWLPLRKAIARRYRVGPDQVLPVSGGASLANWLAIAAAVSQLASHRSPGGCIAPATAATTPTPPIASPP